MRYLREGDTLIVWRLDRLGRNMRTIINTLHELTERGVTVRSLHACTAASPPQPQWGEVRPTPRTRFARKRSPRQGGPVPPSREATSRSQLAA
ncbi:recombinase family protein [Mycobacterium sp.]|uniref:recombinase family protein n=1 Tax=Mycobacterium sp. TaxID=1785 RepID=UPI003C78CC67